MKTANDEIKMLIGDQAVGLAMLRERLALANDELAQARKRIADLEIQVGEREHARERAEPSSTSVDV